VGDLWLKIKFWTKISFFGLLLIYILLFVYNNASNSVTFWFWIGKKPDTSVLLLVLYSFVAGVVVTILVSTTFKTLRQFRDLRHRGRTASLEREMADMRTKAAMLREKPPGDSGSPPASAPESPASPRT
jgi:uncharacterized integral membrane protein